MRLESLENPTTTAPARPRIVCLCGSTRNRAAFDDANRRLTLDGAIVLSVAFVTSAVDDGVSNQVTPADKARLDALHLRKIDLADEVLILNIGGYIGESTSRELSYARAQGKVVRFAEPVGFPFWVVDTSDGETAHVRGVCAACGDPFNWSTPAAPRADDPDTCWPLDPPEYCVRCRQVLGYGDAVGEA